MIILTPSNVIKKDPWWVDRFGKFLSDKYDLNTLDALKSINSKSTKPKDILDIVSDAWKSYSTSIIERFKANSENRELTIDHFFIENLTEFCEQDNWPEEEKNSLIRRFKGAMKLSKLTSD